jgi:hypothetical protein
MGPFILNHRIRRFVPAALLLLLPLLSSTGAVKLSGSLVNEVGMPIDIECTCTLQKVELSTKTNPTNGTFVLESELTSVMPGIVSPTAAITGMRGSEFHFSNPSENGVVRIEIFNALGRREALAFNQKLPAGRFTIDPRAFFGSGASNNLRFVVVTTEVNRTIVRHLPFGAARSRAVSQGVRRLTAERASAGAILERRSVAPSTAIDTLIITSALYPEVRVPVESYTGDLGLITIPTRTIGGTVDHDDINKTITMRDGKARLQLRLSYDGKCMLDDVLIRGSQNIVTSATGVCSAIKLGDAWYTTRNGITTPSVRVNGNVVKIDNIQYGGSGLNVFEQWTFTTHPDCISWSIARKYLSSATLEDSYFPGWDFASMNTWDGALLDDGGVAWNRFLETNSASLGQHAATISLWNRQSNTCLRIVPDTGNGKQFACRFSHQPSGYFTLCQTLTKEELAPKYDLRRYLSDKQDVWEAFSVKAGDSIGVTFDLWPLAYDSAYDRGTLRGVDEGSIREMMHTIARYGVIDTRHVGGNGWRSGYICLHEQWWPQIALALDDPDYFQAISATYDYFRDRAVGADGRVKSRFKDTPGDNMPGTYDTAGFYEAQWGYLMDSQPDYVMVVAEQFHNTGDTAWVRGQKLTCEKVLTYLLNRDSNGNGLLEMMNNNHNEGKSSDWIDIVWAAFENALVNAEMYSALTLWAGVEDILNDSAKADAYRAAAAKLKNSFNKPISQGGFWNPDSNWYVYWRDKDNSIHGNNLTMPVNVCAIAYGLCDDSVRAVSILNKMETRMQAEKLFFWPLCFNSFALEEGGGGAFPTYENGDLFLSWGELAVRAYAHYDPAIAMKYIHNVLDRYEQDGLAFQRYLRASQQGTGDDILSGNCMAVAGLYRDIYGVRPLYNGLYLEPHLTSELNGTQLKYWLRDHLFTIDLNVNDYAVTVNGVTVRDTRPFAVDDMGNRMTGSFGIF